MDRTLESAMTGIFMEKLVRFHGLYYNRKEQLVPEY